MNFELQFLKSGKALCGKVFPNFVATWNWLVCFCSNLKGDADVDDAQGRIKIDRSDPEHPILRLVGSDSSGGSSDEDVVDSLNAAKGDLYVIGGKGIEVSTDGQTIKVSWNEDKEDEDEDPNKDDDSGGDEPSNPCEHDDEGGNDGGVPAGGGDGGGAHGDGSGGGADGEGGVPAGDDGQGEDSHAGDDDCNCN